MLFFKLLVVIWEYGLFCLNSLFVLFCCERRGKGREKGNLGVSVSAKWEEFYFFRFLFSRYVFDYVRCNLGNNCRMNSFLNGILDIRYYFSING